MVKTRCVAGAVQPTLKAVRAVSFGSTVTLRGFAPLTLQLFGTLQRKGVPSKMINFPDEGHWVLKPANSEFWHKEVFAWLKEYVPPGGR